VPLVKLGCGSVDVRVKALKFVLFIIFNGLLHLIESILNSIDSVLVLATEAGYMGLLRHVRHRGYIICRLVVLENHNVLGVFLVHSIQKLIQSLRPRGCVLFGFFGLE